MNVKKAHNNIISPTIRLIAGEKLRNKFTL